MYILHINMKYIFSCYHKGFSLVKCLLQCTLGTYNLFLSSLRIFPSPREFNKVSCNSCFFKITLLFGSYKEQQLLILLNWAWKELRNVKAIMAKRVKFSSQWEENTIISSVGQNAIKVIKGQRLISKLLEKHQIMYESLRCNWSGSSSILQQKNKEELKSSNTITFTCIPFWITLWYQYRKFRSRLCVKWAICCGSKETFGWIIWSCHFVSQNWLNISNFMGFMHSNIYCNVGSLGSFLKANAHVWIPPDFWHFIGCEPLGKLHALLSPVRPLPR